MITETNYYGLLRDNKLFILTIRSVEKLALTSSANPYPGKIKSGAKQWVIGINKYSKTNKKPIKQSKKKPYKTNPLKHSNMLIDETSLFIQLHTLYYAYNDHLIKSNWWIVIVFDMLEKKYKAQNKIQSKGKEEDRN